MVIGNTASYPGGLVFETRTRDFFFWPCILV